MRRSCRGFIPAARGISTLRCSGRTGPVLTTQLYFPNEAENDGDNIFDPVLLLKLTAAPDGAFGRYDFVVG